MSLVLIGGDVNVRGADEFDQFLRTDEAIAKDDVVFHAKIFREFLQVVPVFVALMPEDVRVGDTGNHVHHIGVPRRG